MKRAPPRIRWPIAASHPREGASPFDQVEKKQRSRMVKRLVGKLSAKDQQFVSLYFSRGMSPEAVAEAMQISVKTVYSKKHKIQSRLEGIVAQQAA